VSTLDEETKRKRKGVEDKCVDTKMGQNKKNGEEGKEIN
jgi:hypothetical protein